MAFAIVIVFPEPVTPSSVWKRSPRSSPAVSSAIAFGWSPAGSNGAWRRNGARAMPTIYRVFFGDCSSRSVRDGSGTDPDPSLGGWSDGRRGRGRGGCNRPGRYGKHHAEHRVSRLRLDVDVAFLVEHQPPYDVETHPGAGANRLRREERVEDATLDVFG